MRIPPLNTLQFVDAAARYLNFRRAAEELNLTQGAVAQQVRRLEADLGVKLFQREARGLTLIHAGRIYSLSVRQSLAIIEEATKQLRPTRKRITVSMPPSLASKWFVPRLKSFSETHPGIEVLTEASEKLTDFQTDEVDLAIRQGKPPFPANLQVTPLSMLNFCDVCSPDHVAASSVIKNIDDLAGNDLIHDSHDQWDRVLTNVGLKTPPRLMTFSHTAMAIDAACSGRGIALVPHLLVEADLTEGKLVQLWAEDQVGDNGYYIVVPRTESQNSTVVEMIDWLVSQTPVAIQ